MEKRIISLPKGGNLEVDCTPEFFEVVKKSLDITDRDVSNDDIRAFIYSAFKNGIEKAELELLQKDKV
jgi:hypothetical protein